jgi:hypothetical protein
MPSEHYVPIVVHFDEYEKKAYGDILTNVGFKDFTSIQVDPQQEHLGEVKESTARAVEKIISFLPDKKPIILSRRHYNVVYCHNNPNTALVTFDEHNDSYRADSENVFHDGNFLIMRDGPVYILGTGIGSSKSTIKSYPPESIENIFQEHLPAKSVLSLDIDAFNSETTKAHDYAHNGLIEKVVDKVVDLVFKDRLSYEEVLDVSKKLSAHTQIIGLNIAGYNPYRDDEQHSTAAMLSNYLINMIQVMDLQRKLAESKKFRKPQ